ncbi:Plasma membrane sulfite pump involved in sulfite metabolism [Coemansia sp. RSA 2675]|nr:Plasma membrane sulfite pump involved in sulfite metabolism [Coemansia sp. RSA 2675]
MRRLVKQLQGLLALARAGLGAVSVRWLAVATALNINAQLWRTYASVVDWNSDSSTGTPYPRSVSGDWLIALVTATSYTGLALQLLLLPVLAARLALAVARQPQAPLGLECAIKSVGLLLVSVFATVANYSGIIDITSVPLVADIFLVVWKICAMASAACALIVLPTYVATTMRQSQSRRRRRPDTVPDFYSEPDSGVVDPYPWFLLLLPAIAASASAGDLTMVLQPRDASAVLIYSFVLWGAAIAPALVFTISYIRHQVSRYTQLPPEAASSFSLDVLFPSAPVSQLALAIMSLGIQSRRVWADTVGPSTAPLLLGELAMAAGAILGLVLWASSAAWLINAHVLVIHKYRRWQSHRRREEHNNSVTLIASPIADTTILLVPRQTRSAVAECWQQVNFLAACHAVYPLASFALATAYVSHIWDSSIALHLTQLMLAYVSVLMAVALARALCVSAQWIAAAAANYFGCRRSRSTYSNLLQPQLLHAHIRDDEVAVRRATYGAV